MAIGCCYRSNGKTEALLHYVCQKVQFLVPICCARGKVQIKWMNADRLDLLFGLVNSCHNMEAKYFSAFHGPLSEGWQVLKSYQRMSADNSDVATLCLYEY